MVNGDMFTYKELKGGKILLSVVNEKTGRPPKNYSNAQWKEDFLLIKEHITQYDFDTITISQDVNFCDGSSNEDSEEYYYCSFINDVLVNIRNGQVDYCYYIYQISELLKYEYDNLKTIWSEKQKCFLVYL